MTYLRLRSVAHGSCIVLEVLGLPWWLWCWYLWLARASGLWLPGAGCDWSSVHGLSYWVGWSCRRGHGLADLSACCHWLEACSGGLGVSRQLLRWLPSWWGPDLGHLGGSEEPLLCLWHCGYKVTCTAWLEHLAHLLSLKWQDTRSLKMFLVHKS